MFLISIDRCSLLWLEIRNLLVFFSCLIFRVMLWICLWFRWFLIWWLVRNLLLDRFLLFVNGELLIWKVIEMVGLLMVSVGRVFGVFGWYRVLEMVSFGMFEMVMMLLVLVLFCLMCFRFRKFSICVILLLCFLFLWLIIVICMFFFRVLCWMWLMLIMFMKLL